MPQMKTTGSEIRPTCPKPIKNGRTIAGSWVKGKRMGEAKFLQELKAVNTTGSVPKRPWWLKIPTGFIIAGIFGIGAAYIYYYLQTLGMTPACKDIKTFTFLQECLSTLEANEIGDSLGGAFAPLAFVFLAGALIIQALELAAQRYEINETQAVMAAQVKVSEAQVLETKASTELLREQTNILKHQQQQRDQEIADREFDSAVKAFSGIAGRLNNIGIIFAIKIFSAERSNLTYTQGATQLKNYPYFCPPNHIWLRRAGLNTLFLSGIFVGEPSSMCAEIRLKVKTIQKEWPTGIHEGYYLEPTQAAHIVDDLEKIIREIGKLQDLTKPTSNAKKHEINACEFEATIESIVSTIQWIRKGLQFREDLLSVGVEGLV